MSSAGCTLTEDQLLCCICLEVFTDPVTIPCGHNFCQGCILRHWDATGSPCRCPLCKAQLSFRPLLPVNTFISGLAHDFRQSAGTRAPGPQAARAGDVPCDVCSGARIKALKSCLTCLASYCTVHLEPHLTSARLRAHVLTEPVDSMESRVCPAHKKPLELFCRRERTFVCSHCTVAEHSGHDVVSLRDECEAMGDELKRAGADLQRMVGEREKKRQHIQLLKKRSREDAEQEIANGVKVFTLMTQKAERHLNGLIERVGEQQRRAEEVADGYLGQLEGEVAALRTRRAWLQELAHTQDHLRVLRDFASMRASPPPASNWAGVAVLMPNHHGHALGGVLELENTLSLEKEKLLHKDCLWRVQQHAVDLVLEPNTAHPHLILSPDGKQVQCGPVKREVPNNEERFSLYTIVLARQGFSSGQFYYEVEVSGKSDWTLGVATCSVSRKSIVPISPTNGYWAVCLRNGNEYLTLARPAVSLALSSRPQRVGVHVSYEEGLVSFYDVDQKVCFYGFTHCFFTEELYPLFNPGLYHGDANMAPLAIVPVNRRM